MSHLNPVAALLWGEARGPAQNAGWAPLGLVCVCVCDRECSLMRMSAPGGHISVSLLLSAGIPCLERAPSTERSRCSINTCKNDACVLVWVWCASVCVGGGVKGEQRSLAPPLVPSVWWGG